MLKKAYKNNPNVEIKSQRSYINRNNANYGTKGSVRTDNMKLENNVTTESFEMKNYKLQNYDRMAYVIVKQVQQRNGLEEYQAGEKYILS